MRNDKGNEIIVNISELFVIVHVVTHPNSSYDAVVELRSSKKILTEERFVNMLVA
jgi:hypothetical protein